MTIQKHMSFNGYSPIDFSERAISTNGKGYHRWRFYPGIVNHCHLEEL